MVHVELQASLYNLPRGKMLFGAVDTYLDFLESAGYDSFQYVPGHITPPTHRYRFESLADAGSVTSFYQPATHLVGPRELSYRLLPDLGPPAESVAGLQNRLLKNGAKERVPTVLSTTRQYLGKAPSYLRRTDFRVLRERGLLGPMVYHVGRRALQLWDVNEYAQPAQAAEVLLMAPPSHGFDGIALDLRDLAETERAGSPLPKEWLEGFVRTFAQRGGLRSRRDHGCNEVVVSLPDKPSGREDARKIMAGEFAETRVGRLLGIITKSVLQSDLLTTVKASPKTFASVGGYTKGNQAVCLAIQKLG